jgi:hypothetical protein
MFRLARTSPPNGLHRLFSLPRRSGPPKKLLSTATTRAGDEGTMATRGHHVVTTSLAVLTPIFFLLPSDGVLSKTFGLCLTAAITAHSWIGLNYVITDYVPKVSKALVGPARTVSAGLCLITLVGIGKISVTSPGGIPAVVKGVWNPKAASDKKNKLEF